jgi:hypothetical protein
MGQYDSTHTIIAWYHCILTLPTAHWAESTCYGIVSPQLAPVMMMQHSIKRQIDDQGRVLERLNESTEELGKQQEEGWKEIRRHLEELHERVTGW